MKIRQDPRWPNAHERLKQLYAERAPETMTQEQFGAEFRIGTQGMVWQYLNGYTPLNYDAAAKFAEGLRCTIKDISPEMDAALRDAILPALGVTAWRRAAIIALPFLLLPPLIPASAEAANFVLKSAWCVLCKLVILFRNVGFRQSLTTSL